MRLHFPNVVRPKRAAKSIAGYLGVSLSAAQTAVARCCGYRDWFDLDHNCSSGPIFPLDQVIERQEFIDRQIELSLKFADTLRVPDGDAQYVLSQSHLTGDRRIILMDQLEIRVGCLRATSLPLASSRHRGAVGKLRTAGRSGEPVILRTFGRPTSVVSHRGVTGVGDFEYISPKKPPGLFIPTRLYLPYGFWTESDGSKVLFSRDYMPMWRIGPEAKPVRLEPWLRIRFQKQDWFWREGHESPFWSVAVKERLEERLVEFGVTMLPILADALPVLVHDEKTDEIADAVRVLKQMRTGKAALAAE